ncbi:DUF1028 domain-containing protein [Roseibium sp.]|uniref:DUF1028 domain-containing protein n=1 Tax=Roseibium sp. TaxID=1936156 RepID=UPI003B524769
MRRCCFGVVVLAMISWSGTASATWSVVAVDPVTGEAGGAAATCTPWAAAIIGVVPGKGVIVTQAQSNKTARRLGEKLLQEDMPPSAIIAAITHPEFDPNYNRQQHGIASLVAGGRTAGFTGRRTAAYTGDLQGTHVSVQGNILTGLDVLTAGLEAFEAAENDPENTFADRLLKALEAGAEKGGDRRCGDQTALSAYLVVYEKDDPPGQPSLEFSASQLIRGGESAVKLLREKYDCFRQEKTE